MFFSEKVSLELPALLLIAFLPIWRKCKKDQHFVVSQFLIPETLTCLQRLTLWSRSGKFDSSIVDNLPLWRHHVSFTCKINDLYITEGKLLNRLHSGSVIPVWNFHLLEVEKGATWKGSHDGIKRANHSAGKTCLKVKSSCAGEAIMAAKSWWIGNMLICI